MYGRGLWLIDSSVSSGGCPATPRRQQVPAGVGALPSADESQFLGSDGGNYSVGDGTRCTSCD